MSMPTRSRLHSTRQFLLAATLLATVCGLPLRIAEARGPGGGGSGMGRGGGGSGGGSGMQRGGGQSGFNRGGGMPQFAGPSNGNGQQGRRMMGSPQTAGQGDRDRDRDRERQRVTQEDSTTDASSGERPRQRQNAINPTDRQPLLNAQHKPSPRNRTANMGQSSIGAAASVPPVNREEMLQARRQQHASEMAARRRQHAESSTAIPN